MNGLELITFLSNDSAALIKNGEINREALLSNLEDINSAVQNLVHINSLMLMSINRCTDSYISDSGASLKARMQTINIVELLSEPVDCLRDMQSRIPISLSASDAICPFIVTDKLWLQDNLLCLIANAVKHSTHGTVDVNVSLEMRNEVYKENPEELTGEAMRHTNRYLRFEVSDFGENLSKEVVSKLFAPLKQTNKNTGGKNCLISYFLFILLIIN